MLLISFIFFGAFFGLSLFLNQICRKNKNRFSYIYAFSMLLLGIWITQYGLYVTGAFTDYDLLSTFLIPLAFSGAAFQGVRFKWIIEDEKSNALDLVYYLIPAFISFLYILILITGLVEFRIDCLKFVLVCTEDFSAMPLYYRILHLFYPLVNLYHVILLAIPLFRMSLVWKKDAAVTLTVSRVGYICDLFILISSLCIGTGFFVSGNLILTGCVMANIAYVITFAAAGRYPVFNERLNQEMRKVRYEKSKINGLDIETVIKRLDELMRLEKVFADEDLSLNGLADELGISSQQLSQIINEKLNKNFNTYINEFRVEEAKQLLIEEEDRSINSVGLAVGFNSNSTFSIVFSRHTGFSPREYRKMMVK